MSEWISVKDRLPNEMQRVLAVCDGNVYGAIYEKLGFGAARGGGFYTGVEYWMPLPEPPPRQSSFEKYWEQALTFPNCISKDFARKTWNAAVAAVRSGDYVEDGKEKE